jgi:hypothetical protein
MPIAAPIVKRRSPRCARRRFSRPSSLASRHGRLEGLSGKRPVFENGNLHKNGSHDPLPAGKAGCAPVIVRQLLGRRRLRSGPWARRRIERAHAPWARWSRQPLAPTNTARGTKTSGQPGRRRGSSPRFWPRGGDCAPAESGTRWPRRLQLVGRRHLPALHQDHDAAVAAPPGARSGSCLSGASVMILTERCESIEDGPTSGSSTQEAGLSSRRGQCHGALSRRERSSVA